MTNPSSDTSQLPNCIVCDKALFSIWPKDTNPNNQSVENTMPNGGVTFAGAGAYGSAFDLSPTFVIQLCDDCLATAINKRKVLTETKVSETIYTYATADLNQ